MAKEFVLIQEQEHICQECKLKAEAIKFKICHFMAYFFMPEKHKRSCKIVFLRIKESIIKIKEQKNVI